MTNSCKLLAVSVHVTFGVFLIKGRRLNEGMIPVSPHGEFAPTEFASTIKFLFRVRPQLFEFAPKFCVRVYVVVIELFNVFEEPCQSMYVYVISPLGSLATNEPPVATKRSFLTTSILIRQWIKERGIIFICDSIWLRANSIKFSRSGSELGGANSPWGETGRNE